MPPAKKIMFGCHENDEIYLVYPLIGRPVTDDLIVGGF
jgi:hypothetical protein